MDQKVGYYLMVLCKALFVLISDARIILMEKKYAIFISTIFASTASSAIVNGIKNNEILSAVKSQISLNNKSKLSSNSLFNTRRMASDKEAVLKILYSYGYFDAEVNIAFVKNDIVFNIKLGERYKLNDISLIYLDGKPYKNDLTSQQIFNLAGMKFNSYFDTKQASEACAKIAIHLNNNGFAFAKVTNPIISIDKQGKNVKATYEIVLNGKTIIDSTTIKVPKKSLTPFIQNRILWNNGDVYDATKVEKTVNSLMNSGIFSNIEVALKEPNDKLNGVSHTDVTINAAEAPPREISTGVQYGTSEKFGLTLSWTHHNIDNKGSKLSTLFDVSKKTKNAKLKYNIYDPFRKMQNLDIQAFYVNEDTVAYDVSKVGAEAMLWQEFNSYLKIGAGASCENSETKDDVMNGEKIKFNALGIPVCVRVDTTQSQLDPYSGFRLSGTITPYIGNLKNITIFDSKFSFYAPFKKDTVVIAAYTKLGSIFRDKDSVIPRDKLFFAGGARSIRGYGYQKVGKVNDEEKPIGGESAFEFGVEPRYRISDKFGAVAFIECGNVTSSEISFQLKDMMVGYGFGVRYYTLIGPIRLDIAFPTKRRMTDSGKKIDSALNIYISVGQSF
jgi:translocation and assembly module TamA